MSAENATPARPEPARAPNIRYMIRRDMPEVLVIEHAAFESPWCEEEFVLVLRQRNCIGMVAESVSPGHYGLVVGFMVYELHKSKILLLNVAVHPGHRRRGVGRALLRKVGSKLHCQRRPEAVVLARETDLPAHLWLRACGWEATGVERGHYEDTGEDAYRFAATAPAWPSARLLRALKQFIDPPAIRQWLGTPNRALGGRTPLDVIAEHGEGPIWAELDRLAQGNGSC